ncbi:hypothetical protein ACQ4PT_059840 [Festuca glaucescens]
MGIGGEALTGEKSSSVAVDGGGEITASSAVVVVAKRKQQPLRMGRRWEKMSDPGVQSRADIPDHLLEAVDRHISDMFPGEMHNDGKQPETENVVAQSSFRMFEGNDEDGCSTYKKENNDDKLSIAQKDDVNADIDSDDSIELSYEEKVPKVPLFEILFTDVLQAPKNDIEGKEIILEVGGKSVSWSNFYVAMKGGGFLDPSVMDVFLKVQCDCIDCLYVPSSLAKKLDVAEDDPIVLASYFSDHDVSMLNLRRRKADIEGFRKFFTGCMLTDHCAHHLASFIRQRIEEFKNLLPRDDEDQGTPQLSETQSFFVDGTELVTQEFMVPDQLEQDRIRMEEKNSAVNEKIEEYRRIKSCNYIASKRMFVFNNGFKFAFNALCVHKGALCGCLVVPLMTYLDYLDIKVKELASVVPRISVWDLETVSQFEKLDLVSAEDGTYGNIPCSVAGDTDKNDAVETRLNISPGMPLKLPDNVRKVDAAVAKEDVPAKIEGDFPESSSKGSGSAVYGSGATMKTSAEPSINPIPCPDEHAKRAFRELGADPNALKNYIIEPNVPCRIYNIDVVMLPVREDHFWIVVVANFMQQRFETYCPYYDATAAENIAMIVIDNFKKAYTAGYYSERYNIYNFQIMPAQIVSDNINENDSGPHAMKVILQHSGGFQHKIRENDVKKLREKLTFYMVAFQEAGRDKKRFIMESGEASKSTAFRSNLSTSRITREMLGIDVGSVDTLAEAIIGQCTLFASTFVVAAGLHKFLGHTKFLVVDNYVSGSVLVKFQDASDLQKVDGMIFRSGIAGPFVVSKVNYVQAQPHDYAELFVLSVPKSNF